MATAAISSVGVCTCGDGEVRRDLHAASAIGFACHVGVQDAGDAAGCLLDAGTAGTFGWAGWWVVSPGR